MNNPRPARPDDMASRIDRFPWAETALGPRAAWSPVFEIFVQYMLRSHDPIWMSWGQAGLLLYNDVCATRVLAERHPDALGQPSETVWGRLWPSIQANAARRDWRRWQDAVAVWQRTAAGESAPRFFNFSRTAVDSVDGIPVSLWLVTDHTPALLALRRPPPAVEPVPAVRMAGAPDALVHDLRTPLNTILAWSQVLATGVGENEQHRGVDAIMRSARRQARLLDDAGHGEPAPTNTAVGRTGAPAEADDAGVDSDGPADVDLGGVRVLVVDDDDDTREVVASILAGAGASVEMMSSASAGLSCLRRRRVDIIVSDITMSGMDGYEFMATVRRESSDRVRMIPSIALTALGGSRDRQRAYRAGFQLHLVKPVEASELKLAVASLASEWLKSAVRWQSPS